MRSEGGSYRYVICAAMWICGRSSQFCLLGRMDKPMNSLMDKSEIYPQATAQRAFTGLSTLKTYRPQFHNANKKCVLLLFFVVFSIYLVIYLL